MKSMNLIDNKLVLLDKLVFNDIVYKLKTRYKSYRIPLVLDVMFRTMFFNENRKNMDVIYYTFT